MKDSRNNTASDKISIPIVYGRKSNRSYKVKEDEHDLRDNENQDDEKEKYLQDPIPTVPEDFLTEIDLMKIPKYNLPKTVPKYKKNINAYPSDGNVEDNTKDDIAELDLGRYFNENYHVPPEYKNFKFKFKGYHEGDSSKKKLKEDNEKEDHKKEIKTNLIEFTNYEDYISTTIIPPTIITETKFNYEDNDMPEKFSYENVHGVGLQYEYENNEHEKEEYNKPCYGCNYGDTKLPYKHDYFHHSHHFSGYFPPRYVHPYSKYPRSRRPPYYVLKNQRRPINFHPTYPYHYQYPKRKPYPLIKHSKPPLIPYYRPKPYPHYRNPKYFPYPQHPIQQTPVPYSKPQNFHKNEQKDCPPSKIVKEVHIHHHPETKIKTIPVPVPMDEANHNENYDHETVPNGNDYENGNNDDDNNEDELDENDHRELQYIKQYLDDALRKNKEELIRQMVNGQQYQVHEDSNEGDSGNVQHPDYDEDNPEKYPNYEPKRISIGPNAAGKLDQNVYNDKVVIEAKPIRLIKLNSYKYNYTTPKNNYKT